MIYKRLFFKITTTKSFGEKYLLTPKGISSAKSSKVAQHI